MFVLKHYKQELGLRMSQQGVLALSFSNPKAYRERVKPVSAEQVSAL